MDSSSEYKGILQINKKRGTAQCEEAMQRKARKGLQMCGKKQALLCKQKGANWSSILAPTRMTCKRASRKNVWGSNLQVMGTKTTMSLHRTMVIPGIFEDSHFFRAYVSVYVWHTSECWCVDTCACGINWESLHIFMRRSRSVLESLPSQGFSLNLELTVSACRASLEEEGYWGGLEVCSLASLSAHSASCSTMV